MHPPAPCWSSWAFSPRPTASWRPSAAARSSSCALIGDPRIVFLDEPTSGVDPLSRRGMWRLFEREKARRVIALCRNYMDDADILADRIAIMDHGTSLFLIAPTRKRRLCCR
jgi:ABC-type multidrug transport system ATPase subunit